MSSPFGPPPKETPFQELLEWARNVEATIRMFSDRCYGLAQHADQIGSQRKLARLGEAAAQFADAITRTRDF